MVIYLFKLHLLYAMNEKQKLKETNRFNSIRFSKLKCIGYEVFFFLQQFFFSAFFSLNSDLKKRTTHLTAN